jgi:octaprenyl-diphosphate synthase
VARREKRVILSAKFLDYNERYRVMLDLFGARRVPGFKGFFFMASPQATHPVESNPISITASKIADLAPVYALVQDDFRAVNELIPHQLASDVTLVEEMGAYIVESGGKRLRPLLVLLTARALDYAGNEHIGLAAVIEFLHTATLLHDDVVDHSGLRRGRLTANEKWGNAPSVLVGDFLYSRAFQLMVELGSLDIMQVLSEATNTIAEGEVLQMVNVGNCELSESQYREVIRCKTALLFESSTHTGALLAQATRPDNNARDVETLRCFGLHFGLAYQLVDDWLDYTSDADTMGKNAGDDLAEGKLTLPLIYALHHATAAEKAIIHAALRTQSHEGLPQILRIVEDRGGLAYTQKAAVREAQLAQDCLAKLRPNPFVDAMHILTEYSISRLS